MAGASSATDSPLHKLNNKLNEAQAGAGRNSGLPACVYYGDWLQRCACGIPKPGSGRTLSFLPNLKEL